MFEIRQNCGHQAGKKKIGNQREINSDICPTLSPSSSLHAFGNVNLLSYRLMNENDVRTPPILHLNPFHHIAF